jgi:hypothetical protein
MAQFKPFAAGVEVNGETVLSVIDGMGSFRESALHILAENGIPNPQPGKWYSQKAWLDAFKSISDKMGDTTLLAIGRQIPENAQWPPEVNTLEKALGSIDVAYHMNHRGGEIGHYQLEMTGSKSGKMICRNPYPDAFDRGIIDAVCRKFKPKETLLVNVKHDDSQPCRKKGADSCTFLVTW